MPCHEGFAEVALRIDAIFGVGGNTLDVIVVPSSTCPGVVARAYCGYLRQLHHVSDNGRSALLGVRRTSYLLQLLK